MCKNEKNENSVWIVRPCPGTRNQLRDQINAEGAFSTNKAFPFDAAGKLLKGSNMRKYSGLVGYSTWNGEAAGSSPAFYTLPDEFAMAAYRVLTPEIQVQVLFR